MKKANQLPPGWDEQRIRDVLDFYEHQTEEEAVLEHEAALANPGSTLMEVPAELVPVFRQLIAEHQKDRVSH